MGEIWNKIKNGLWLVGIVAGIVIGIVVGRKLAGKARLPDGSSFERAVAAIDAERTAKVIAIKSGADEALRIVEETYEDTIEILDERDAAKAAMLRNDPAKLAKFLAYAGVKGAKP